MLKRGTLLSLFHFSTLLRLGYREQLGLVKQDMVRPIRGSGDLIDRCIANLPFELTPSQRHCVDEIWEVGGEPGQEILCSSVTVTGLAVLRMVRHDPYLLMMRLPTHAAR